MTRKILRTLLAASAVALLAASSSASAQATASFQVSANVLKACTITATPIAFGNYEPIGANDVNPLDQTGTVTIRCTRGTAWSVDLDAGQNASGGRRMQSSVPGNFLGYELYSDNGFSVVWDAAAPVTGTALNRAPVPLTVYGRIPGGQDATPEVYTDSVIATINF